MRDLRDDIFRFDAIEIDVQNLRVTVGAEIRPLEPKSFRLLLLLVRNPGRALTKEEIMAEIWPGTAVSDNSLTRSVAQIRKALDDDPKSPRYVETVPTVGYRFLVECKSGESRPAAEAPSKSAPNLPRRRILSPPLAMGVCLALAAGVIVWWFTGRAPRPFPLQVTGVTKLTSYPGDEREPAISPDGAYVAFSWSGPAGDNYDIYVVQIGGSQPLRLTTNPAPDSFPAWSPDGRQIAFVRRTGLEAEIVVVPPLAGSERSLHHVRLGTALNQSQHPLLSWSPDGKSIVYTGQAAPGERYRLFRLSVETGAVLPLTSPEPEVVGDSDPALSRDGKWLAFVRYLAPLNGRLMVQPLDAKLAAKGDLIEVTKSGLALRSPIWMEDGRQILFADEARIFQWRRKQAPALVYSADGVLGGMSLGPERPGLTRQAVVASAKRDDDIWSIALLPGGLKAAAPPQALQRSTAYDHHPEFSPDGRHIAFASSRSGAAEIWVCDADGGNPRQLTHLGAHVASFPRWSPDGTRIAFHARLPDVSEIYIVDAEQGVPRQITHQNPGLSLATWSHDGRFLYGSTLVGGVATSYRIPLNGGPIERLWAGSLLKESADGKYALYWKTEPGIFRRSLQGDPAKNPEELLVPDFWERDQAGGFEPVEGGVYYVSFDLQGKARPFRYFDYASKKSVDVAPAAPGLSRGFSISPDRRHMLFAASAEVGGDLLLLELK